MHTYTQICHTCNAMQWLPFGWPVTNSVITCFGSSFNTTPTQHSCQRFKPSTGWLTCITSYILSYICIGNGKHKKTWFKLETQFSRSLYFNSNIKMCTIRGVPQIAGRHRRVRVQLSQLTDPLKKSKKGKPPKSGLPNKYVFRKPVMSFMNRIVTSRKHVY